MTTKAREELQAKPRLADSPFWAAFLISPEVILIHRPDGTILEANPAAQEKLGYSIEELEGMNILDLVKVDEATMRERARKISADGELTFRAFHRRKDGTTFESEVRTRRFQAGGEELIVGIGLDITDLRLAEMLNAALERMSAFAGSRMDFDVIMRSTVRAAREAIGSDSAMIVLRDDEEWRLSYEDGFARYFPPGHMFSKEESYSASEVIRTGKAIVVNDVLHDPRMNREYAARLSIRSLLMAPLRSKGETVGIIAFFCHRTGGAFSDTHVDFANKLAYSISLLMETARAAEGERRTERFLHTVLETVPDAILVLDGTGRFTYANKEAERLTGLPREEILRRRYDDPRWGMRSIKGDFAPQEDPDLRGVFREGRAVHGLEYWFTNEDGDKAAVSINMRPRLDPLGRPDGAITALTDITQRRRDQEQLERDKEELSTLMETTPSGILLLDRKGRIVFLNRSAEEILGAPRKDALGRLYDSPEWVITDYEGLPYPAEKLPFQLVMDSGRPVYGVRHAIRMPDGHRAMLLLNAAPLFDREGEVSGVIVSMEDVTVMTATEKALRISMKTSNDIIQQIPSGILLFQYAPPDRLTLLSINPTADAILGGLESKVGLEFGQIWKEGAFFATKEEFLEVVRTGRTLWREGVHYSDLTVEGSYTFRAFYLPDDRLCINFDDITERVKEANVRREAFEQIERNIEHFATLVDRIRNPLSAIMAHTEGGACDPVKVNRRASEIEAILTQLDTGWLESEKVRDFLKKTL